MKIRRIDHFSVRALDMEATQRFYTDILGFRVGPRPPFKFPGYWLFNGEPPKDLESAGENFGILHIIGVDRNDPQDLKDYLGDFDLETIEAKLKACSGPLDHIALSATGRDEIAARCERNGVTYFERSVPSLGLHQMFIRDPNDIMIELNFPVLEAPRAG